MATALDIITASLQEINVTAVGEASEPEDVEVGIKTLNRMISGWKAGDVDIEQASLNLSDDLTVDDKFHDAIMLQLAKRLAGPFQRPFPQARDAEDAYRVLVANFKTLPTATVDDGLTQMPSEHFYSSSRFASGS